MALGPRLPLRLGWALRMSLPRLEYGRFPLGRNQLELLNTYGMEGWRLCVIDGTDGIFCRDRDLAVLRQRGDEWAAEQARIILG
jgi:hypothetical protein